MGTRVRQRTIPASHWSLESGHSMPYGVMPSDTYSIVPSVAEESYIQDIHPSRRTDYNNVYHTKNQAAKVAGEVSYTFSPPTPPLHLKLGASCLYRPPSLSTFTGWNGLCDDLASKLSGRTKNAAMILVSVKELASTVGMIRNPFSLLKPNWRKVAKNHTASHLAKKSANVWLEYLYGWKSLYTDITGLATSAGQSIVDLQSEDMLEDALNRYSSSQKDSGVHPTVYQGSASSEYYWMRYTSRPVTETCLGPSIRVTSSWSRLNSVACLAKGAALTAASKTQKLLSRFDLSTPHAVRDCLWEMVPFSFVVDWFVDMKGLWAPINRAIIASSASSMLGYSTKYDVTYNVSLWTGIWSNTLYSGVWAYRWPTSSTSMMCSPSAEGRYTSYVRKAGLPPDNDWPIKLVNRGLSLTQCASGISLIAQRVF